MRLAEAASIVGTHAAVANRGLNTFYAHSSQCRSKTRLENVRFYRRRLRKELPEMTIWSKPRRPILVRKGKFGRPIS